MAGINLSDATHTTIDSMSYDLRTSRKNIVEEMFKFTMEREQEFLDTMFGEGAYEAMHPAKGRDGEKTEVTQ